MIQPPNTANGPVLRDIHLPPDPSWWPPAPGWWILALVLLVAAAAGWWLWRRHRRARIWRALVLREVDQLSRQHVLDGDSTALASGLHQLLRRVAREQDPHATQQRGEAWQATLARVPVSEATRKQLFALEQQVYRRPESFDAKAAMGAVRQWLAAASKSTNWKAASVEQPDA